MPPRLKLRDTVKALDYEAIPYEDGNELADAVRTALKAAKDASGLSFSELAERCNLSTKIVKNVFAGRRAPTAAVAERLVRVLWQHEDLSDWPKIVTSRNPRGKPVPRQVQSLTMRIMRKDYAELERLARQVGMSVPALAHLAVQRFLEDSPPWVTIAQVADAVRKQEVLRILADTPGLVDILEADVEVARAEAPREWRKPADGPGPYWDVGAKKILEAAAEDEATDAEDGYGEV